MVNAPAPPVGSSSHSIRRSCLPRLPASCEPRPTEIEAHVPKESSMTFDLEMAEIAKVFFQESREGLDVMESGLLSLGATADSENINSIFRAAHSIKGGSATFGFAEVAGFTHGVETLLDEMRNGVRPVTAEAIQALLQACDCLREMIAATEAEQPLDQVRIASLNGDIKHILGETIEAPAPVLTPARAVGNEAAGTGAASEPGGWRVRFEPVADLLRLRNEPTRMFAELRRLGAMVAHADTSRLPLLDALDPESCYLSWNIDITGQIPRGRLDEVFDWVDSGCRLEFTRTGASAPVAPAPRAQASAQPQAAAIDAWSADMKAAAPTETKAVALTEAKVAAPADADRSAPAGAPAQKASGDSGSIRVATEKVDNIINLVGELLITQSMLSSLADGLEIPERRVAAGKQETGTLELAAFHEGGNIIIEVRDDGAGLNKAKILQKARERALVAPDQELTDEQIDNLIFMPGFSTAEQISDVSGRGVGMDVVRRNINDLGGHVQISSKEGLGSTIRIRLPLTLAILDGQLVRVGKEIYIISLLAIVETIQVARERVNTLVGRTEVFRLRDEYLPVVKLCDQFGVEPDSRSAEDGLLVVLEADGKRVGVLVDDLLAQQQVVIKSLESNFKSVAGIAGATILGDGTVALIIDAPGLISSAAKQGVGAVAAHAA